MTTVISLNTHGFGLSQQFYLYNLISNSNPDFVLLQEHHLLSDNVPVISNAIPDNYDFIASGADGSRGHASGGCAIIFHKRHGNNIDSKFCDNSRFAAISINNNVMVLSIYLPCDNYNVNYASHEFTNLLDFITALVIGSNFSNIVIGGDFNVDFCRNNAHTADLLGFIDFMNVSCSYMFCSDDDYTYHRSNAKSNIDHFLYSENCAVDMFSILYDPLCPSDHNPVKIKLLNDINVGHVPTPSNAPRVSWHVNVNDAPALNDYIAPRLRELACNQVLQCNDHLCIDKNHKLALNNISFNIVNIIRTGCAAVLRKKVPTKKRFMLHGWDSTCSELRDTSLWWHWLWCNSGKTRSGVIYNVMKRTRLEYHLVIKRLRASTEFSQASTLMKFSSDSKKFFGMLSKIKGRQRNFNPCIRGKFAVDAANEFANDIIVNQNVTRDEFLHNKFRNTLQEKLGSELITSFTTSQVSSAIDKLKSDKSDCDNINSTVVKLLDVSFSNVLCLLFNSLVTHGFSPDIFNRSILTPLLKANKKDVSDTNSYRLIASVSILSKIFDYTVIDRYHGLLSSNHLQFGYKKRHSTVTAAFVLKEVANYFISNGSNVYACSLDASKAFDNVSHDTLFDKLLQRGVPASIVNMYSVIYANQTSKVSWNGFFSKHFDIVKGVLQGGVLSPILFTVYIDDLYWSLKSLNLGCFIGHIFFGLVGYADDNIVLAPTLYTLERALKHLSTVAKSIDLTFNPDKSTYVCFSRRPVPSLNCCINGQNVKFNNSVKYLGITIDSNLKDFTHLNFLRSNIIGNAAAINQSLRKFHPDNTLKVLKSKCLALYGIEVSRLNSPQHMFKRIETAWNRAIRKCYHLNLRSHCCVVNSLTNIHFPTLVCNRISNFLLRFSNCNPYTNFLANHLFNNTNSIFGNNYWVLYSCVSNATMFDSIDMLKELIDIKFGCKYIPGFNLREISILIDDITTS